MIDLNEHHLPEDAGEYAEGLSRILDKIPEGWGRWISHDKGWYRIICEADEMLSYIDPDYEIHQVKEKFGTLCFYFGSKHPWDSIQHKIMNAVVREAEHLSSVTCEFCGKSQYGVIENIDQSVRLRTENYYIRTLCDTCAREAGYPIEDNEDE